MQGKHHSKQTKQKMSNICKGKYCGENNPMYGKHHSEETKKKISIAKSKSISNKVWVNNDNKSLLIDKKDLDVYLNKGYTRGRIYDKIYIHKDDIVKCINIEELDYYISLGFVKGRK